MVMPCAVAPTGGVFATWRGASEGRVLREAGPRLECGSCSSAPSQLRRKPKDMLPSWPLLPLVMVPMSSRLSRKGKLKVSRRVRCNASEDEESMSMDFLQKLIQKQRSATELGICTREWHPEIFDDVPPGYRDALESGIDLVDVLANGSALQLLADAKSQPRFCVRVAPKPTLGLGYILNKNLVMHLTVLSPLQQAMKRLNVGYIETLTIHSDGQGRMHFPFWVYDAVVEAYQKGLCSKIGISHPNADAKTVMQAKQELEKRGATLSSVFVKLSLLEREAIQLVKDCRAQGLQVFATNVLGPDELASGRYTAANPTGGEISVPRFTLAQLMPLRPLHQALEDVVKGLRIRAEKPEISTTQVALQWVVSKGASPLCDVTTEANAKAVTGCTGEDGSWKLTPEEEAMLDSAADEVAKGRRRW
ncbi:unnamed protein product [Durusdinium trenchii]|uniref:NADP-dependent oxidoreductase domain-containing protein n=1 Tax=Durusdinium trenchii TaxID=1381693 RepID=A0ABP0JCP9_9DINO